MRVANGGSSCGKQFVGGVPAAIVVMASDAQRKCRNILDTRNYRDSSPSCRLMQPAVRRVVFLALPSSHFPLTHLLVLVVQLEADAIGGCILFVACYILPGSHRLEWMPVLVFL